MQRSKAEALASGRQLSGFMTARGAADFLTRSTSVLGALFVGLSIVIAAIAGASREPAEIDTDAQQLATPSAPANSGAPRSPQRISESAPAQEQRRTIDAAGSARSVNNRQPCAV